ncbi:MAG TPA: ketopantoate reductase C-terminal domain-containing protein [Gemmataceae bacterium]|jgi:2-dehydropantoate 2-reductase|nr:ketopantoate reductase C-terminal domain-containing protein [Gemmataceae bacterium]
MDAITIVGAGGIGCAVGYAFAKSGAEVTFVEADAAKVAYGMANGVAVDRRPPLSTKFVHFDHWRPTGDEIVWLCTKCYDNPAVLARLPAGVTVVPVQNGFDRQLEALGHAAEGIAAFVSECRPHQTHTRITRPGKLYLGFRGGPVERRMTVWADRLQKAGLFPVRLVSDIRPYKHSKLMYNAAISPLAAAAGLDNGQLLADSLARRLFFRVLQENHAILRAAGLPLGTVGPLSPGVVAAILRRPAVANALAWAFYPSLRGTYCSMAGDIVKGRTEIDNYTGHLLRLAGNRPCPLNRRVYEVFKRLEHRREVPGVAVLRELED